jgi:hypothetical protein
MASATGGSAPITSQGGECCASFGFEGADDAAVEDVHPLTECEFRQVAAMISETVRTTRAGIDRKLNMRRSGRGSGQSAPESLQ